MYAWVPLQSSRGGYEWSDRHKIRVVKLFLHVQFELNTLGHFKCPHRLNSKELRRSERGGLPRKHTLICTCSGAGNSPLQSVQAFLDTSSTWRSIVPSWTLDLTRNRFWVRQAWYRGRKVNRCYGPVISIIKAYSKPQYGIGNPKHRHVSARTRAHTHTLDQRHKVSSFGPIIHGKDQSTLH